jgi:hypothetical protein
MGIRNKPTAPASPWQNGDSLNEEIGLVLAESVLFAASALIGPPLPHGSKTERIPPSQHLVEHFPVLESAGGHAFQSTVQMAARTPIHFALPSRWSFSSPAHLCRNRFLF